MNRASSTNRADLDAAWEREGIEQLPQFQVMQQPYIGLVRAAFERGYLARQSGPADAYHAALLEISRTDGCTLEHMRSIAIRALKNAAPQVAETARPAPSGNGHSPARASSEAGAERGK